MKTKTQCIPPILGCLKKVGEHLGRKIDWQTTNEIQQDFLKKFMETDLSRMSESQLKSFVTENVAEINAWFKENGFSLKLDDAGAGSFYVGSILDVLVTWIEQGKKDHIKVDEGEFSAVRLRNYVRVLHNSSINSHPVIKVQAKGGYLLYMCIPDEMPETPFSLMEKVEDLRLVKQTDNSYEGVIFPMIDYDGMVDISWIKGMSTSDDKYYIAQALQQTKFRMNEKGARAQSAVGMHMTRGMSVPNAPCVIDKPFLLWIEHQSLSIPVFSGFFGRDVWKEPNNLE